MEKNIEGERVSDKKMWSVKIRLRELKNNKVRWVMLCSSNSNRIKICKFYVFSNNSSKGKLW